MIYVSKEYEKKYEKLFGEKMHYSYYCPRPILRDLEYYNNLNLEIKLEPFLLEIDDSQESGFKKQNLIHINQKKS